MPNALDTRIEGEPMLRTLLLILISLGCLTSRAEVRVPRLFGDHVVLQQRMKNAIWGWADAREMVTVEASWGKQATTTADAQGRWKVFLETPAHSLNHRVTIRGKNTIELQDVAVGEVWICAGQSNLGWKLANTFHAEEAIEQATAPGLRIFKSAREHWHEPLEENRDRLCRWRPSTPESAAETSAVAYYFGKTLHDALGVPVGIIQRAYAGTPIEGWMPWEIQKNDPRAVEHKRRIDDAAERQIRNRGETQEKALTEFQQALDKYNAQVAAGETMVNSFKPLTPPVITKPANLGHQYPAHMFNAMIAPIQPFGMRGMIWYQGERNAKNVPQAEHYRHQLKQLIEHYRESWHALSDGHVPRDFPFQFTQLPSWNPPQDQPIEGIAAPWAVSREAMRLVADEVPNTQMAVAIDTGDAVELHPKNKRPLGQRHACLALAHTYKQLAVGGGPRYRQLTVASRQIVLEFDSVGSGLRAARQGPLDGFAIAGADRQWHWAEAKISANKIILSSPDVEKPVAARYAWAMNPSQRNLLYNREGFPASPFRTDDWPLFDPTDDEVVEVNKPDKPPGYQAVDWERPRMQMALAQVAPQVGKAANGLAPEIADLSADDVSYVLEAKLPDLKQSFVDMAPARRADGLLPGELPEPARQQVQKLTDEISAGKYGNIDSLLIHHNGKLILESYFRRGRINYPHYQMSITKSYTALAVGRAIQLGHLSMDDLNRPVIDFLPQVDREALAQGAEKITLAEAMNMRSGIRLARAKVVELRRNLRALQGQGQVQAYLQHSAPIPPSPREFKYQSSDPSLVMQVLEAVVPGSARDFIERELLAKLGISNFAWQKDVSGLPKSAAGSSMCSRDMVKWGLLVQQNGKWNGEQLVPAAFVTQAIARLHTNQRGDSYGYFWWRHDVPLDERRWDCISGRGAGGQYILLFPQLNLVVVVTAHQKGMGGMLQTVPQKLLPLFIP